jgi:hypothetical protein
MVLDTHDFTEKRHILASYKKQSAINVGVELLHEQTFNGVLEDEVALPH